MSAHTAQPTNTNVSEAFVWTCEIETGKKFVIDTFYPQRRAFNALKGRRISVTNLFPKRTAELLLISVKYLSTWNPAVGVPKIDVRFEGGSAGWGEGSLCQAATGITQINHLLTSFPNPHSFRTTPGECTQSQSSTRTGSLCPSGAFCQFRLPMEGGLRLGSRLALRWRQHIWKHYKIKDQRNPTNLMVIFLNR